MSFQPSEDQQTAIDGILSTLFNPNNKNHVSAILTGSAGTGKTTVVSTLINSVQNNFIRTCIELCATTHRAVGVLQNVVDQEVSTVHALFKLQPGIDKYGKETLKRTGTDKIPQGSLVIIDEASMLGNSFLSAIADTVRKKALKVLFVGDPYQLPPPTDTCSLFDGSLPTFTLTKVHRQKGDNPILDKAIEFRDFINGTRLDEPVLKTELNSRGEGITVLAHSTFVSNFVKKYMAYTAGAEVDAPLCTYTNDSAINYNDMIRKSAYFLEDTIAPFYPEERLVANSIVKTRDRTILNNNETVIVKSFSEASISGIPGYMVHVEGNYDSFLKTNRKKVFCPINKGAAEKVLEALKKEAKSNNSKTTWVDYYALKNYIADLRPPFAGTTHKAQGGTFSSVFIDKVNIDKCRDPAVRARLLYVALTRASKNVYVNS